MKKIRGIFLLLLCMILVGCNKDEFSNTLGNCTIDKCVELIDPSDSVSKINEILGINGVLVDAGYNEYFWELSENAGIYVTYYSGDVGIIRSEFPDEEIKNPRVSFAKINEIESAVNTDESLTYQDLVNMLGNVEGVNVEKSESELKYKWVSDDNKYLIATISQDTKKCIMITGMY